MVPFRPFTCARRNPGSAGRNSFGASAPETRSPASWYEVMEFRLERAGTLVVHINYDKTLRGKWSGARSHLASKCFGIIAPAVLDHPFHNSCLILSTTSRYASSEREESAKTMHGCGLTTRRARDIPSIAIIKIAGIRLKNFEEHRSQNAAHVLMHNIGLINVQTKTRDAPWKNLSSRQKQAALHGCILERATRRCRLE